MPDATTGEVRPEGALARLIRRRLRELNVSQAELARRGNLAPAHLGQYIGGGKKITIPTPETIEKLRKALDVDRDEVVLAIVQDAGLQTKEVTIDERMRRLVVAAEPLDDDKLDTVVTLIEHLNLSSAPPTVKKSRKPKG